MSPSPAGRHTLATGTGVLAALALGLTTGSVLTEGAVLVPWWRALPAEDFLAWYAGNATRLFDYFGVLEIVSALVTVVAAVLALFQRTGGARFFVIAAVLVVAVLALFPLYFEQVNAGFAARTTPIERVPAELSRWAMWHWVRTAMALAAFAAAVLGVRASRTDG